MSFWETGCYKEPGSETPEQNESIADIQVTEDTLEPDQTSDS